MRTRDGRANQGTALDEVLDALAHSYRRHILLRLSKAELLDTDEFGRELENGERSGPIHSQLHHVHLPKLGGGGFVDWDRQTGTVTRGRRFGEVVPLLDLVDEHRDELPDCWL